MKNHINYILVIMILFISAKASILAISPIFVLSSFMFTTSIFIFFNYKVDKLFIFFTVAYFLISFIYFLKFEYVDILYIFYYYLLLCYAYMTIKIVKFDFFKIFHNIVYSLALLSIPLFLLQLIMFDSIFDFIGIIQNSISPLAFKNEVFASNFLFTIDKTGAIYRNSGFAWEPKGFSNFLILAMIINTNINNFKLNKKLIVLIVALMTTFSTVGDIILFTGFSGYLAVNKKIGFNLIIPLVIIVSGIFISSSDFIYKKILNEIYTMDEQADMVYDKRYFKSRSLGRFGSLLVDYKDFIKHPILGYGIHRKDTDFKQLRTQAKYSDTKLVRVNGFSDRLATFGIVGIIFYIAAIFKGFKNYFNFYNNKGSFFILIIFLMIEFATNLLTDPFWMIFLFIGLINYNKLDNSNA